MKVSQKATKGTKNALSGPLAAAISEFMAQKPKVHQTGDGTKTVWAKGLSREIKVPGGRCHIAISQIEFKEGR